MTNEIVNIGPDPYTSYAAQVVQQQGMFLTFKNGEFLAGQDNYELKIGTRLAANVAGLMIGWRRWFGARVTDDRMELLSAQIPRPSRSSLGDNDPDLWEQDERNGTKRDPWQFTNTLQLVDAQGEVYLFSTGSKGGLNAIGKLCKAYGLEYRQRPGMVPIIELANDFYNHATYGKTYVPVFNLIDWANEAGALGDIATQQPQIEAPGQRAANPIQAAPAGARVSGAMNSTTKSPSEQPKRAARF